MTALVLLPYVASTNLLLSRATVTIRLMGADSGDTIVITLLAETTFPNPILINCKPKLAPPQFSYREKTLYILLLYYSIIKKMIKRIQLFTQYFGFVLLFFQFPLLKKQLFHSYLHRLTWSQLY